MKVCSFLNDFSFSDFQIWKNFTKFEEKGATIFYSSYDYKITDNIFGRPNSSFISVGFESFVSLFEK